MERLVPAEAFRAVGLPPTTVLFFALLFFGPPSPVSLPVRCALFAFLGTSLANAAPSAPGPQLRQVLGQPDLAAPARMLELTFLEGGTQLLVLDATGTAQLWDVAHAERRGLVFGPVVLTAQGLRPAPPGKGCLLEGPSVAEPDGRLVLAGHGVLRSCDISGRAAETARTVPALSEDGTALALAADGSAVAQGTAFG